MSAGFGKIMGLLSMHGSPLIRVMGMMRGLVFERQLGSYSDLNLARRGPTTAIVPWLQPARR